VMTALLVGTVLLNVALYVHLKTLQQQAGYQQREYQSLEQGLERIKEYRIKKEIMTKQRDWMEPLRILSHLIPEQMYLTQLDIKDDQATLKGVLRQLNAQQRDISLFTVRLSSGPFEDVTLIEARDTGKGVLFHITFRLKP